jgi:TRAP transporter TAXI family solute receptor
VFFVGRSTALCAEAHWPDSLTIGTASPGGTYHAYGEGLARILSRELGIPVATRPTEGPNENIMLLEAGQIQLAFVTLGIALQAWNGTGDWTGGKQMRAMRAIFPMYDTPFQFAVPRDSPIQSMTDLTGKRVGVGPHGGTSGTYIPEFFRTLKIDATLVNGDWDELASQLQERKLDALAVAAGVPFPSFIELERKTKLRYLPLAANQIVDLRLTMPELGPSVVAAGVYPSLLRHYQTVGLYNFAVAHRDLPSDLVYAIVDAVFANREELSEAHPAASATVPANFTRNTFLPFHDGASRWYHNKAVSGVMLAD